MRAFLASALSLILGAVLGIGSAYVVYAVENDELDLRSYGQTLGLQSDQAALSLYGFQPFWTLDGAQMPYNTYLTHLNYFALQLAPDGTIKTTINAGETEPGYANLQNDRVKERFAAAQTAGIQTALTIQMINEDEIIALLRDPETHAQVMIDEVEPLMREYQFDELNIDIESFIVAPRQRQEAFAEFMRVVDEEVAQRQLGIVSIDVVPKSLFVPLLTDMRLIEPYVDLVVLMTYDFHTTGSYIAGPVAPVGGGGIDREFDVTTSLEEAIRLIPREKILLGIPLYGYEWDTLSNDYYAPAVPGTGKIRTQAEIAAILDGCPDCQFSRDERTLQPMAIVPVPGQDYLRQIYYEDHESIAYKADLARAYGIAGLAYWALGYETPDFNRHLQRLHQD